MRRVMWSVVAVALCSRCWADIEMKEAYLPGEEVSAVVTPTGVPDNAMLRGVLAITGPGATVRQFGDVYAIWPKVGQHQAEYIGTWVVTDTGELGGKLLDFGLVKYTKTFTFAAAPGPPPPQPVVNPYQPASAFQAAAAPVSAMSLKVADARALAAMYATVASQARAGAYKSLGEIRADLVQRGTSLGLKGKYSGLAPVVDTYFAQTLGLEDPVPAARVGDALETIAWAVFESGRLE